jgi:hypothetical protein
MSNRQKTIALKPKTKRRPSADLEKGVPEGEEDLLLEAKNASGVPNAEAATVLVAQAAAMDARGGTGPENAKAALKTAIQMLEQIKPEGALQSMLAVQMIGVHNSAVKFLRRATDERQNFEGTDANVHRAVRLMRLFKELLEALASLRGKTSEQKVTVEHVHVHEGGQAIVGSVTKIGDVIRGEGGASGD